MTPMRVFRKKADDEFRPQSMKIEYHRDRSHTQGLLVGLKIRAQSSIDAQRTPKRTPKRDQPAADCSTSRGLIHAFEAFGSSVHQQSISWSIPGLQVCFQSSSAGSFLNQGRRRRRYWQQTYVRGYDGGRRRRRCDKDRVTGMMVTGMMVTGMMGGRKPAHQERLDCQTFVTKASCS